MLVKQDGKCAICIEPEASEVYLSVDHEHDTAKIRGLLCKQCNLGLGNFKDDPELLMLAAAYLTEGME